MIERQDKILAGLAVLAVLTIGIGISNTVGGPLQFEVFPGTSTLCGLSADDVRISSNDADVGGGKAFIVTAVAGCSDHIIEGGGLVQKESLEGSDPDTGKVATAKRDFQLGLTNLQASAENKIQPRTVDSREAVYTSERKEFDCKALTGCGQDAFDRCSQWQGANEVSNYALDVPHGTDNGFVDIREGFDDKLQCYRAEAKKAEVGEFYSTTTTDFSGTMTMCSANKCQSEPVDKQKASAGFQIGSGDQTAYVRWDGSMRGEIVDVNMQNAGGETWRPVCDGDCHQTDNNIGWKLTADSRWSDYSSKVLSFESSAESSISNDNPDQPVQDVNSLASEVTTNSKSSLKTSVGTWVDRVSFEGGAIKLITDDAGMLERPVITVKIDADWVGFRTPVAQPEIQSPASPTIQAPGSETINVQVTNTGDLSGTVQVSASCPSPLAGDSQKRAISAGGTTSYSLTIDSGPSDSTSYNCQLKAKDLDATSIQSQTGLSVNVVSSCPDGDADGVCNDGADQCPNVAGPESNNGCPVDDPNDSDGDGVNDRVDDCPNTFGTGPDGCPVNRGENEYANGCSDGVDNDGDGLIDDRDPDCQGDGTDIPWPIVAVGAVIVALAAIFRREITAAVEKVI